MEQRIERFWSYVDRSDSNDCLEWTGWSDRLGYGHYRFNHRMMLTHRIAYELIVGPIPNDLPLDHLCRNPKCVNPEHLEPVTPAENQRRGVQPRRIKEMHARVTHCPQGHQYTVGNTRFMMSGGYRCRQCRKCNAIRTRAKRLREREQIRSDRWAS